MSLLQKLDSDGFVFLKRWRPELATDDAARAIGNPIDVRRLLQTSSIQNIQTITPKPADSAPPNQYSGRFGLGGFPFHSDLAHWSDPPRYFLLRCLQGSPTVFTRLLQVNDVVNAVGKQLISKAVFLPRKKIPSVPRCALPMSFERTGITGLRWDELFLTPFNRAADTVADVIPRTDWGGSLHSIALVELGDTLIIDNWRVLHARSEVDGKSYNRRLERIYLSTIEG